MTKSKPTHTPMDAVKAEAGNLRDAAVEEAKSLKDAAVSTARVTADEAKETVADEVGSFGQALRRSTDGLRGGSAQEQALSMMADGIADIADGLRDKSLSQLVSDAADLGRRHPVAFLGGAALMGFAAVRLAKASARTDTLADNHG